MQKGNPKTLTNPIAPRVLSCKRTGAECGFILRVLDRKVKLTEIAALRSLMSIILLGIVGVSEFKFLSWQRSPRFAREWV